MRGRTVTDMRYRSVVGSLRIVSARLTFKPTTHAFPIMNADPNSNDHNDKCDEQDALAAEGSLEGIHLAELNSVVCREDKTYVLYVCVQSVHG